MFENGMLRRIFGPKSGEVTIGWRKLHNKKLLDLEYLDKDGSIVLKLILNM
jgi:hypothetical protein